MDEYTYGNEYIVLPYRITPIGINDTELIKQALAIYDVSLGQKYIPPADLLHYIDTPNKYVILGATSNKQLLGVIIAHLLDESDIQVYTDILRQYNLPIVLHEFRVGLIKSVAVDPQFRHRGVGTRLTLDTINSLKEMSCSVLFAISWVSNRPDSSQHMFEKLGFQNILTVSDYWTEDSIKEGYLCPNCGNPCHCTALFYFRKA